jgi:drug/metabolite transporter (DMT)-like permease
MTAAVRRNAWIAWAAVCLIWGTTYLAMKIALETIPPFLMGGIRYVIGGLILALWLTVRRQVLPPAGEWARLALLGFLMITLGNGGVVWAEQYLASGLTAVVIATSPFWMVAIDALLPGADRLGRRQWGGLFIGFCGILMLVWPDLSLGGVTGRAVIMGVLSVQVACIGWSVASAYTRRHAVSRNVLGVAAVQMFFGGCFLLLAGTMRGEWPDLAFSLRTTAALVYLTLAGSVVAFAAYSYALRHLPIASVSLYTYVNPIIAVALGTALLGEPFRLSMIASAIVIGVGMFVVRPMRRSVRA